MGLMPFYIKSYRYNNDTGWETTREHWNIFDKEWRWLSQRTHSYYITSSIPDTNIEVRLNTFDTYGNYLTSHTYQNGVLSSWGEFIYSYSPEGWIKSRKRIYHFPQAGSTTIWTYFYTHFCDGRVKTEVYDDRIPQTHIRRYEYRTGTDCNLSEGDESLVLFPNPNNGQFEIQSNLLTSEQATIRIFTSKGQEVFSEKVSRLTENKSINLLALAPGRYYVFIQDGLLQESKVIVIGR